MHSRQEQLDALREECLRCSQCPLSAQRRQVVFGVGPADARVLFIGEGPGEYEDLYGEPFVGAAGRLLDKMMAAIDLDRRTNAYIANIVKCRPPHNRDPLPVEQDRCLPWLRQQFGILQPEIVVCLGRIAACRIIKPDLRITREHGRYFRKGGVIMTAMFHPAAILRNPSDKPAAFEDFLRLQETILRHCPSVYEHLDP